MAASVPAVADVLYDNQPGAADFVDQEFSDFPTYSTYLVGDVTFAAGTTINSITIYTTSGFGNWGAITQARVNIFAKTGSLPGAGDNPAAGTLVAASWSDIGGGVGALVASGLNIPVSGANWVGLTAVGAFGAVGQEFHLNGVTSSGDVDAYRNPGGSFGLPAGTNWGPMTDNNPDYRDISMTIEGEIIPAPGAIALLGLAGLASRRRRRA
jgi:uncharacterized protein (TIGR03382 family)